MLEALIQGALHRLYKLWLNIRIILCLLVPVACELALAVAAGQDNRSEGDHRQQDHLPENVARVLRRSIHLYSNIHHWIRERLNIVLGWLV